MNRSTGAFTRTIWTNFGIVITLADGGSHMSVQNAVTRREALGMAFRKMSKDERDGAKVAFCKDERDMSNDERGQWDMPTYRAETQRPIDYSVLDQF